MQGNKVPLMEGIHMLQDGRRWQIETQPYTVIAPDVRPSHHTRVISTARMGN